MGSTGFSAETSTKRRAFSLPSFRKLAGEQQQRRQSEDAFAASRKAAAWQWHSRGVAETVVPTKAPRAAGAASRLPAAQVTGDAILSGLNSCMVGSSRFKAEAIAKARANDPIPKPPPTPLYDEVELSRLKYPISSFLQQLNSTQSDGGRKPAAITGQCIPPDRRIPQLLPRRPSAEEQVCISRSSASLRGSRFRSLFGVPVSALHSLYRKILSRPSQPRRHNPASAEPTSVDQESEAGGIEHHYHRYVHHHHHHYHHYGTAISNFKDAEVTPRFHRFSESTYTHGCSPTSVYDSSDEIDSEAEKTESPDSALSALHRRHSDSSFSEKLNFAKAIRNSAATNVERKIVIENAEKDEQRRPSRHSSERYFREALKVMLHDELRLMREDGKSRRRHSTENISEGECMRYWQQGTAMEEAVRAGRGGRRAPANGVYRLSALMDEASAITECKQDARGRHSASYVESCRQSEELVHETLPLYAEDMWRKSLRMPFRNRAR